MGKSTGRRRAATRQLSLAHRANQKDNVTGSMPAESKHHESRSSRHRSALRGGFLDHRNMPLGQIERDIACAVITARKDKKKEKIFSYLIVIMASSDHQPGFQNFNAHVIPGIKTASKKSSPHYWPIRYCLGSIQ
jgi:hypothetical protein